MADFGPAIQKTLHNEGSAFVQNPVTGEVSKYGITLKTWNLLIDPAATADTIQNLTEQEATAFYLHWFWPQLGGPGLSFQTLAEKVFDIGVNQGPPTAAGEFQGAINDCGGAVTVDGLIGPKTIAAANALPPAPLLDAFKGRAAQHYRNIVSANPDHAMDLPGWLARVDS